MNFSFVNVAKYYVAGSSLRKLDYQGYATFYVLHSYL